MSNKALNGGSEGSWRDEIKIKLKVAVPAGESRTKYCYPVLLVALSHVACWLLESGQVKYMLVG